jgi:beta-lactamase regulating signal transducer with metallopeptidase domain
MGFGVSLILTAVGAVLAWAVNVSSSTVDVNTIGYILLVVGIVGMLVSLAFWSTWVGPGYFTRTRHVSVDEGNRTVTDERASY